MSGSVLVGSRFKDCGHINSRRNSGMRIGFALLLLTLAIEAAHWNQFRGPVGTGHTSANLPLTWSETENVTWKIPIPGRSWSSPVLWENQIWLTTATPDGKELSVLCLNALNGQVLHQQKLLRFFGPVEILNATTSAEPDPRSLSGTICSSTIMTARTSNTYSPSTSKQAKPIGKPRAQSIFKIWTPTANPAGR